MSADVSDFRSLGDFESLGKTELLNRPLLAIFSSAQCPAIQILKAHDYAKEIRNGEIGVISGFHAPVEKEVLEVILKGTCPIVVVLGRRLQGARIPAMWKTEIEKGRMLVLSPFGEHHKRVTKETALTCNDLAAKIAGQVLIIHAREGGSLEKQVEKWKSQGINIGPLV